MIALLLTAQAYQPLQNCWNGGVTHWDDTTSWNVTKSGGSPIYSGLTDTEVLDAISDGFDVWRDTASCCSDFRHAHAGLVSQSYSTQDSTNIISFEENNWDWSLGSVNGVIAVTFSQWGGGCALTGGDQVYNGVGFDFTTTSNPGWGSTDLQSITAHENGHWAGLGHSNVNAATMWFSYPGGISARALDNDDEAGVCNAHPGICGPEELDCSDGIDDDEDGAIDCEDSDCAGQSTCMCPVDGEVGCDTTITGSNVGGVNTVESYSCASWTSTGPEAVYTFEPTEDGTATIRMTGLSADLDLVVTTGLGARCNPGDCESTGGPDTSDEVLTMQVVAGETYMVVADGWEGASSSFELSVDCPGEVPPTPPTPRPPPTPDDVEDPATTPDTGEPQDSASEIDSDPELEPAFVDLGTRCGCRAAPGRFVSILSRR